MPFTGSFLSFSFPALVVSLFDSIMIIVSTISFNKSLFNIISNYIRLNSNTHVCCFIQIDLEKYTKGVEDKQLNLAKVVFVLPISRHFTLCVLMRKSPIDQRNFDR